MEENVKLFKNGVNTVIEIEVLDAELCMDYLGRSLLGMNDTSDKGFKVNKIYFDKDRYRESLSDNLANEIQNKLNNTFKEINELLNNTKE